MVAIIARIILNGSWLKDVVVPNTMDEFIMEALREPVPAERLEGPGCPIKPIIIRFKRTFYNDHKFCASGIPKWIEEKIREQEKS